LGERIERLAMPVGLPIGDWIAPRAIAAKLQKMSYFRARLGGRGSCTGISWLRNCCSLTAISAG